MPVRILQTSIMPPPFIAGFRASLSIFRLLVCRLASC